MYRFYRAAVKTEYDEQGRLKKTANSSGNGVEFVYNPLNSLETVKDALGNPTTYEYDTRGNVVTEVDAVGKVTKRTYDDDNNELSTTFITQETGVEGYTNTYTYDKQSNRLSATNALGETQYYTYNARNQLLTSTNALGNTTSYTYDARGNVLSKKDATGYTVSYTYDSAGRNTSIIEGVNDITTFEYDRFGNRILERNSLGQETNYTFDTNGNQLTSTRKLTTATGVRTLTSTATYAASGKVKTFVDAEGGLTTYNYDSANNVIETIDGSGRRTKMQYDSNNRLTTTIYDDDTPNIDSDNLRQQTEYDLLGNKTAIVDLYGRRSPYTYDVLRRPTGAILPDNTPLTSNDNNQVKTGFNQLGWAKSITKNGFTTQLEYDKAGRMTSMSFDRDGIQVKTIDIYDRGGRVIAKIDPKGQKTELLYDQLDRQIATVYEDGTSERKTYNHAGKVTSTTDRSGHITNYEYDVLDRLTAAITRLDGRDLRTDYSYDEDGNLITQTDALLRKTRYEYDGLKRRTAVIRPLEQRSETVYDPAGLVSSTKDFNGQVIKYNYNGAGQLIGKQFVNEGNRIETYTISPDGKSQTVTDARGNTVYQYDEQGRILSRKNPDNTEIKYTYDMVSGQIASVITLSGTTQYHYNNSGQLIDVIDGLAKTEYKYNILGQIDQKTLANGVVESYRYDSNNRLQQLEQKDRNNVVIAKYSYTYDANGNKTKFTELSGTVTAYAYDSLDRLIKETVNNPTSGIHTSEYAYDDVGNRTISRDSLAGNTTYVYNANDWLLNNTTSTGFTTYVYDLNGNLTNKTSGANTTTYNWDTQNRLTGATIVTATGTQQATYQYDANGVRVASTIDGNETRYLVDDNRTYAQVLEEYKPGRTSLARYVYDNGADLISQTRAGVKSFYLKDGHSGVRILTDSSGNVTDAYNYDAYGKLVSQTGSSDNAYLYRGEQSDNLLSLQYLRARYYDPNTGRFISTDPVEGSLTSPVSRHRYLYGNDNPIVYSDPSGEFSITEALGGIVLQDILYGIAAGGIATAGVGLGAFITGVRDRLGPGGHIWNGTMTSSSVPFNPFNGWKYAQLSSSGVSGNWIIVPLSIIPGLDMLDISVNGWLGLDIKEVQVVSKPSSPGAAPHVWDLWGPYLGVSVGIRLGSLFSFNPFPNNTPTFIMGWGVGTQLSSTVPLSFQFRAKVDISWSWPLPSSTPTIGGGGNPPIPPSS